MRRKRKNERKSIVIFSIILLFIMTVGYAAFQTNVSIIAKGNIKKMYAGEYLRKLCNSTNSDGLYKDTYVSNKCVYKGADPSNYITFNNETWRIMSVESDGTLKIMRKDSIGKKPFDSKGLRTTGYCSNSDAVNYGCNVWMQSNNFSTGILSGAVSKDSELNTYLNNTYYNNLSVTAKEQIVSHEFGVGAITYENNDLNNQFAAENKVKWVGKVGIMSVGEIINANSNVTLCGNQKLNSVNFETCKNSNYISATPSVQYLWTISPEASAAGRVYYFSFGKRILNECSQHGCAYTTNIDVLPVVYLNSKIILSGTGTDNNPYIIN